MCLNWSERNFMTFRIFHMNIIAKGARRFHFLYSSAGRERVSSIEYRASYHFPISPKARVRYNFFTRPRVCRLHIYLSVHWLHCIRLNAKRKDFFLYENERFFHFWLRPKIFPYHFYRYTYEPIEGTMFDKIIRVLINVINYIKRGINYIKRLITGGDRGSVFYYMQF